MTAIIPLFLVAAAAAPSGGLADLLNGPLSPLVMILPIGVLFYFLLIRPQSQYRKQHEAKINAIKRGDTVVLTGGIKGKIVRVEEDEVGVEIAQNVNVKVVKSMIQHVSVRGEPAAANDSKS